MISLNVKTPEHKGRKSVISHFEMTRVGEERKIVLEVACEEAAISANGDNPEDYEYIDV